MNYLYDARARALMLFGIFATMAIVIPNNTMAQQCPAGSLTNATIGIGTVYFYGYVNNMPDPGYSAWLYCVESTGDNEVSHTVVQTEACWIDANGGTWSGDPASPVLVPGGGNVSIGTDGSTGITGVKWDEQVDNGSSAQYYLSIGQMLAPSSITWTHKGGPGGFTSGPFTGPDPTCNVTLPVEFSHFDGFSEEGRVTLVWETATERNNAGFAIEHAGENGLFDQVGFVDGAGTTLDAQRYSYVIDNIAAGINRFRLQQIDLDGTASYSSEIEVNVSVPGRFQIGQAYPNPFNPMTVISLAVAEQQAVRVVVYDALGHAVQTVLNSVVEANQPVQVRINAGSLPSGAYIVRFHGEQFVTDRQIILAK